MLGNCGGGTQNLLVAAGGIQEDVTGVLNSLLSLRCLCAVYQAWLRGDTARIRDANQVGGLQCKHNTVQILRQFILEWLINDVEHV